MVASDVGRTGPARLKHGWYGDRVRGRHIRVSRRRANGNATLAAQHRAMDSGEEVFGVAVVRVWKHCDRLLLRIITGTGMASTEQGSGQAFDSLDDACEYLRAFVDGLERGS